jgi:hypothetical protein
LTFHTLGLDITCGTYWRHVDNALITSVALSSPSNNYKPTALSVASTRRAGLVTADFQCEDRPFISREWKESEL